MRRDLERKVMTAVELVGVDGLQRADLAEEFVAQGVPQSTVYRWISDIITSGAPAKALARVVQRSAKRRRDAAADDQSAGAVSESIAAEAVELLPVVARVDVAVIDGGVGALLGKLRDCIGLAEACARHCQTADGGVRNLKGLIAATEMLRRTVDSAVRLQEMARGLAEVDEFHHALFQALRAEAPMAAERALAAMQQVANRFAGVVSK